MMNNNKEYEFHFQSERRIFSEGAYFIYAEFMKNKLARRMDPSIYITDHKTPFLAVLNNSIEKLMNLRLQAMVCASNSAITITVLETTANIKLNMKPLLPFVPSYIEHRENTITVNDYNMLKILVNNNNDHLDIYNQFTQCFQYNVNENEMHNQVTQVEEYSNTQSDKKILTKTIIADSDDEPSQIISLKKAKLHFTCQHCSKQFKSNRALIGHKKIHKRKTYY